MVLTKIYLIVLKNISCRKWYTFGDSFELSLFLGFIYREYKVKRLTGVFYRFLFVGRSFLYNDSFLVSLIQFINNLIRNKISFLCNNTSFLKFSVLRSPFKYNQSREHFMIQRVLNEIEFSMFVCNSILIYCFDSSFFSFNRLEGIHLRFNRILVLKNEKKT